MFAEILVAGGTITIGAKAIQKLNGHVRPRRRETLLTTLHAGAAKPTFDGQTRSAFRNAVAAVARKAEALDETYQTFMINRFDTLLGSKRHEQINALAYSERVLEITPEDRSLNHAMLSSLATVGTAIIGNLIFPPLRLLSLGFGLYTSRIYLQRAYHDLFHEKQITATVVGTLNSLGVLFGGYFVIGGTFTFLFSLGEKLILITQDRSFKSLVNVFEQPESVFVLVDGIETEVPYESLRMGDQLLIHAGQNVPIDGTILEGVATIDQHALTGEAQPAEKEAGAPVFASTVVLTGKVRIQVEKSGEQSVAAQLSHILNNTAGYELSVKSKSQRLSDNAVIPTLLMGALAGPVAGYESMIAIWGTSMGFNIRVTGPIAMLNFLHIASNRGILIKDGRSLELLHKIDVVVFDKTGTLTQEQPHVAHIHPCNATTAEELLTYAAAAEYHQTHPIARAILAEARKSGLSLPAIDQAQYEVGYGIKVQMAGRTVHVGSDRYMRLEGIPIPNEIAALQAAGQAQGHSLVMVAFGKCLAGAIELEPTIRPEAAEVIAQLHERELELVIISGDQEEPTRKLAQQLGIDRYFANTLPEHKAALVEQLQAEGRTVCFVGDGINDSIALKKAHVSVSLRGATTAATDTAQIVFMEESLHQLPFLFTMGRKFDANIKAGFASAIVPGVSIIGGAFLFHWGLAAQLGIWIVSFATNLGIAMKPLLDEKLSDKLTDSTQVLMDNESTPELELPQS
jgi:Cu2+-exporting ATPase